MGYLVIISAYLIGSLSFAIIVSYCFKLKDPRQYGSLNAGATNVMRSGNKIAAFLTFFGDALKGVIVILGVKYLLFYYPQYFTHYKQYILIYAAVAVMLGHIYPLFFAFKGGKGVATGFGILLALNILLGVFALIIWLSVFRLTKISSLAAITSFIISPIAAYLLLSDKALSFASILLAIIILYKHQENIKRLWQKQEYDFKATAKPNKIKKH